MKKSVLTILCVIMILIGWFASDILKAKKATAGKTYEYKVVVAGELMDRAHTKQFEETLNTYAKQGWRLVPWGPTSWLIFEK